MLSWRNIPITLTIPEPCLLPVSRRPLENYQYGPSVPPRLATACNSRITQNSRRADT
jgi:hypothetical protein